MVKLIVKKGGSDFYVLKKVARCSDPEPEIAARSAAGAKLYSNAALKRLEEEGKIRVHFSAHTGTVYLLVDVNAPLLLGGRPEGFFKILKCRFGLGHVQRRAHLDVQWSLPVAGCPLTTPPLCRPVPGAQAPPPPHLQAQAPVQAQAPAFSHSPHSAFRPYKQDLCC